jgi:PAS domain S-box-containing protein
MDERTRAENQYRELFEQAPIMYLVTANNDGEPIIKDCNQKFLSRLGYTKDEVLDEPLADFYTEESRQDLLQRDGYDCALRGELIREERQLVTKRGDVIDTLLRATPRYGPDGDVIGTVVIYLDLTHKRRVERLEHFTEVVAHHLRN